MNTRAVAVALAVVVGLGSAHRSVAAPASSGAYHIVLPRRALAAGETATLRIEPPPPAGTHVSFLMMDGLRGIGFTGDYRAPFVIPPGTPSVHVTGAISGPGIRETTPEIQIELLPGAVPGAEDCLGPGQSFAIFGSGLEPQYTPLDELPMATHTVEPVYPRSQYVRGVTDTVIVRVLLCRSGHVLDAIGVPKYRDTSAAPVYEDPRLVDAAVVAVRQGVFQPGRAQGVAFACMVDVPIPFRL